MKDFIPVVMLAFVFAGCMAPSDPAFPEAYSGQDTGWFVRKTIWFAELPSDRVVDRPMIHRMVKLTGVPPFETKPKVVSRGLGVVTVRVVGPNGKVDLQFDAKTGELFGATNSSMGRE